ncbi:hypothetical protein SmJEL517_g03453 [Synchytrium microbalum]|uniref:Metallo-beta-lactamase domain-containing protein n=1 Tax=Synchytrium microbalum TaxID=1806994 RepID=A0A507BY90_9FUNG|nr:uncharacterized protein SmJEL517_g03453 [Synchytrium microbalum]TPX33757.1 hypothetical protein SmJEL517_g03453 [Synchytrium microbalum]
MPTVIKTSEDRPAGTKTHHQPDGTFVNPWPSFKSGDASFLRVLWNWERERSKPPPESERLAVRKPDFEKIQQFYHGKIQGNFLLTWIGHAAMLITVPRMHILFDPCLSDRCSPSQLVGPKRITPPACQIEDLPPVDVVVISHNHYDHLDKNTILALAKSPQTYFFVPLGCKKWFTDLEIKNVVECDWWDEYKYTVERDIETSVSVAATPCQHFSGRSLWDRNHTLWASWVLVSKNAKFFFGGDTGLRTVPENFEGDLATLPTCPAFNEIGEKYGPFNLSAIPIGAYSPRWFMSRVHCDPSDAVLVHKMVKSQKSVGMHFGTFILTDEPVNEPPKKLKEEAKAAGLAEDEFITIEIGESIVV